jgi:uncharacterized spore protein YtfJ
MDASQLFSSMQEQMDARRVFGEPVERDGMTVIPVARVGGGGGAGRGRDKRGEEGEGGGFGMGGAPAGVYVIKDGKIRWMPAVDINRIVLVIGAVGVAYLIAHRPSTRPSRRRG